MSTPLEDYEYYAARVDRINAARARRLYWNIFAILIVVTCVMAAVSFLSQKVSEGETRDTADQSETPDATIDMNAHTQSALESSVYYRNCTAARAAGAAPIYEGQPGYRPELDGDSDGIACEPYHPR